MPPSISSGPPLSSRAVLIIGALSLACLALTAALAFEVAGGEAPVALDTPVAVVPVEEPSSSAPAAVFPDDPEPIPADLLTSLELAAEEPLDVELDRFLDALHHGFGVSSARVEPTLRPYAFRLAGRLNVRGATYLVRVIAPDAALADARTDALRRLFDAAGVVPGRLRLEAERGAPALTAAPA